MPSFARVRTVNRVGRFGRAPWGALASGTDAS